MRAWKEYRPAIAGIALAAAPFAGTGWAQDGATCRPIEAPVWFCAAEADWLPFDDGLALSDASYLSSGIYAQVFIDPVGSADGMTPERMVEAVYQNFRAAAPDGAIETLEDVPHRVNGQPMRTLVLQLSTAQGDANVAATILIGPDYSARFSTLIETRNVTDFRLQRHMDFLRAIRIGDPNG